MAHGLETLKISQLESFWVDFCKKKHRSSEVGTELSREFKGLFQRYSDKGSLLKDEDALQLLRAMAVGFQKDFQKTPELDYGRETYRFAASLVVRLFGIEQWVAFVDRKQELKLPPVVAQLVQRREFTGGKSGEHYLHSLKGWMAKGWLDDPWVIEAVRGNVEPACPRWHFFLASLMSSKKAFLLCFTAEFKKGIAPEGWGKREASVRSYEALTALFDAIEASGADYFKALDRAGWLPKLQEISGTLVSIAADAGTSLAIYKQQVEKNSALLLAMIEDVLSPSFQLEKSVEKEKKSWLERLKKVRKVYPGNSDRSITKAIDEAMSRAGALAETRGVSLIQMKAKIFVLLIAAIPRAEEEKDWGSKTYRMLAAALIGFLLEIPALMVTEGVDSHGRLVKLLEPKEKIEDPKQFWVDLSALRSLFPLVPLDYPVEENYKNLVENVSTFHWRLWFQTLAELIKLRRDLWSGTFMELWQLNRNPVFFLEPVKSFLKEGKAVEEFCQLASFLFSASRSRRELENQESTLRTMTDFLRQLPEAPCVRHVLLELLKNFERSKQLSAQDIEKILQDSQQGYGRSEKSTWSLWKDIGLSIDNPEVFRQSSVAFSQVDELCEEFFKRKHKPTAILGGQFQAIWKRLKAKYSPEDFIVQADVLLVLRALAFDVNADRCHSKEKELDFGREAYRLVWALVSLLLSITQLIEWMEPDVGTRLRCFSPQEVCDSVLVSMRPNSKKNSHCLDSREMRQHLQCLENGGSFLILALSELLEKGLLDNFEFIKRVSGQINEILPFRDLLLASRSGKVVLEKFPAFSRGVVDTCYATSILRSDIQGYALSYQFIEMIRDLIQEQYPKLNGDAETSFSVLSELFQSDEFLKRVQMKIDRHHVVWGLQGSVGSFKVNFLVQNQFGRNPDFFKAMIEDELSRPQRQVPSAGSSTVFKTVTERPEDENFAKEDENFPL